MLEGGSCSNVVRIHVVRICLQYLVILFEWELLLAATAAVFKLFDPLHS